MATKKKNPDIIMVPLLSGFVLAVRPVLIDLMQDERLTEDQRQVLELMESAVRNAFLEHMRGPPMKAKR